MPITQQRMINLMRETQLLYDQLTNTRSQILEILNLPPGRIPDNERLAMIRVCLPGEVIYPGHLFQEQGHFRSHAARNDKRKIKMRQRRMDKLALTAGVYSEEMGLVQAVQSPTGEAALDAKLANSAPKRPLIETMTDEERALFARWEVEGKKNG